jgi:parallel beta-helix repeat protein
MYAFHVGIVRARTITVPDDYPTIQAAVNAASPSDLIIVRSGTYTENVIVNKDHLTMKSESGGNSTIVQASNFNGNVFEVTADNVNIIGFVIRGAATAPNFCGIIVKSSWNNITNNIISNNHWGIDVSSTHNSIAGNVIQNNVNGISIDYGDFNDVRNNKVFYNNDIGIWLSASRSNKVENNAATNNMEGILLQASDYNAVVGNVVSNNSQDGIRLEHSTNNGIINNTATNQRVDGILLIDLSNNSTIVGNNISGNGDFGIDLADSSFNEINQNSLSNNKFNMELSGASNNTIVDNSLTKGNWGIYVVSATHQPSGNVVGSGDNRIYHNSFVDNVNVYPESVKQLENAWDNGYPSGGNFWSDYQGTDLKSGSNQDQPGSDGIGDTPYIIDANNRDRYPLINKPLTPDFSVKTSPTLLTIQQSKSDVSTLTITSINGFSSPVQLTVTGAPMGVSATLNPEKITPPAGSLATSSLTVSVSTTATPGNFTLTVTGTNGTITHSTDVNLKITPFSSKWTFAIITDLHIGRGYDNYSGEDYYLTIRLNDTVERIKQLALTDSIRFVVVLGDLTEHGKRPEMLKAKGILDSLTRSNIPYFPVLGNHDVDSEKGEGEFYSDFNASFFENQCKALGTVWQDNRTYLSGSDFGNLIYLQNYAFEFKHKNFVFLDFIDRHYGHVGVSLYSQSIAWLKTQLEEGMPTFLFSHIPMIKDDFLGFYSISKIDGIIHTARTEHEMNVWNFAGHIHGYYDSDKTWSADFYYFDNKKDLLTQINPLNLGILRFSPVFIRNVNGNYEGLDTPDNIPVVATEAVMVASNEPVPKNVKAIIRIVTIAGEEVDYNTVEGEFWALNPSLKIETKVNNLKVDFEAYAFTTNFAKDKPLHYILDYGDGSARAEEDSAETKLIEFGHTYDLKGEKTKTYKVKLSVFELGTDKNESITQELTMTAPSGCFIFTAVLGTKAVQDLKYMRLFRDNVLISTPVGHAFVDVYYIASPPIAEVLSQNDLLRIATRIFFVMPALYFSEALFSQFSPSLLIALIAATLLLYKKGKITIFLSVLGRGLLIAGSMLSLVFILGILAHTWTVCAIAAAILLPTVIPLASVPFVRKLLARAD